MYCVSKEAPIKADRLEDSVNEVKRVSRVAVDSD